MMDITPQKMRYLYVLLFLTVVMTLPWLGLSRFHTRGEPREAIVAQTMLAQDNWVMPHNNGGEIAYKPPFMHWCVAACGKLVGEVNEYVARFPSALSAILLAFGVYFFYARRRDGRTALMTAFISFSSFEMFRAAFACRVDMVLTLCMVGAMMLLETWHERGRRYGLPWMAILLMSLGTLTKGPVAIVLPCAVAWVCALLRREGWLRETVLMALTAVISLVLPALWYYAAYQQQGDSFLQLFMEENIYRFLGKMSYRSHENGIWYYFVMLPAGLLPWTLMLLPLIF
ncbi:MAG: ArnT family glycosyltransferase, partial [Bacteroidaceae bacterium]